MLRYIYRSRRKRMERSVCFEVEQKVRRSLLPKTISISVISDYLSENKLDDGQLEYALEIISEFFVEDENEFKKCFPRYLAIL